MYNIPHSDVLHLISLLKIVVTSSVGSVGDVGVGDVGGGVVGGVVVGGGIVGGGVMMVSGGQVEPLA